MNAILKKMSAWFGGKQVETGNGSLSNGRNSQYSVLHDGSEAETRGQLVQVLLRDLIRKNGMPPGCVQCQMQITNSRSGVQGIHVRLVIKDWDERLMRYTFAFQKALLTEVVQFEPQAASWLLGISWQLEVASSCPLTELPGPQFWQQRASSPATAGPIDPFDIIPMPARFVAVEATTPSKPALPKLPVAAALVAQTLNTPAKSPPLSKQPVAPIDDTAQDLERLFAIRDNELANMAANNLLPAGYESTEPAPLQLR